MSAVYAITDFRRGAPAARGRARRSDHPAPPAGPPPILAPPRQAACYAVPGSATVQLHGEAVSITAAPENCVPGTVAERVTCLLCGAYWPGHFLPDGRPVLCGGVALMRFYRQDGTWRYLAKRCRCDAGQRLPLADMVGNEWRWFVTRQLLAMRRGVEILSDAHMERFLIDPRGAEFSLRWHDHIGYATRRGRPIHRAKREAYLRAFMEWHR